MSGCCLWGIFERGKIKPLLHTMPVFFQQEIDTDTRLAVWHIAEPEDFFLEHVPLQRQITHPHKRLQHLAGRYLLQYLFSDFPLSLIKIADTRKPFLEDEAYHFSISHADDYAAAIVSRTKRVGVDVETPSPKVQRISGKFLHPEEAVWMEKTATTSDLINQLTVLWCAKEAVFKWWSYGNVDFSEMIRLAPTKLNEAGKLEARFVEETTHPLQVNYQVFEGCCLAWVVEG